MALVVYGVPLSPFVRKVEVVLREKGLDYTLEPINPFALPPGFDEINPAKRIPVLRDTELGADGVAGTIPDSSAICAYLERRQPQPALYPSDAFALGRALWFEEFADSELAPRIGLGIFRPVLLARLMGKQPDLDKARATLREQLPPCFDYLERELQGEHLVGGACTIADLAVASQLANLALAVGLGAIARWPKLVAHAERVLARPSFAANLAVCRKLAKEPVDLGA